MTMAEWLAEGAELGKNHSEKAWARKESKAI